jgi:hypothetical protein
VKQETGINGHWGHTENKAHWQIKTFGDCKGLYNESKYLA